MRWPNETINVIRDGYVIATTDVTRLPLHDAGGLPRMLFMSRVGDRQILCVLKPMQFINHVANDRDCDAKFVVARP